jgi:hypothetical protein
MAQPPDPTYLAQPKPMKSVICGYRGHWSVNRNLCASRLADKNDVLAFGNTVYEQHQPPHSGLKVKRDLKAKHCDRVSGGKWWTIQIECECAQIHFTFMGRRQRFPLTERRSAAHLEGRRRALILSRTLVHLVPSFQSMSSPLIAFRRHAGTTRTCRNLSLLQNLLIVRMHILRSSQVQALVLPTGWHDSRVANKW